MKRMLISTLLPLLLVGSALAPVSSASSSDQAEVCGIANPAEDFAPTAEFGLSDAAAGANPEVSINVSQEADQQELGHVHLCIPAGFNLPKDEQIENGDLLGSADVAIDAGPRCAGGGPASAPATFNDREIFEQDRTDEQADSGVRAVWVVDLQPVTTIALEVRGTKKVGFTLDGDIPANQFTCPPLTFAGTIFAMSQTGQIPIFKNPPVACPKKLVKGKKCRMPFGPGDYLFEAFFDTQESGATVLIQQTISIT